MARAEKDDWHEQLAALRDERKKVVADTAMDGAKRFLELERIDEEIKALYKKLGDLGPAGTGSVSQHTLESARDHGER